MINLSLTQDKLHIKFDTENYQFLKDLKEHFTTFTESYIFHPKYKAGIWDGKISVFDTKTRTLPFGLLYEFLKFKKDFYHHETFIFSDDIKSIFKGYNNLNINFDLKFKPRDYQKDCILSALKFSKGIIISPTASGKSLIITYIWKILFENKIIEKQLLIVPNLTLISQFKNDMIDYGINKDLIGEVWSNKKEWDKSIVISTWQSLSKNINKLNLFDSVFIDETHISKSTTVKEILSNCFSSKIKLGFTGTLQDFQLDKWNVMSYLGPVIKEYTTKDLKEQGFLTPCQINKIYIEYKKPWKGDYFEIKNQIFQYDFRLNLLKNKLKNINRNFILLLVNKVEDEGQYLKDYLLNTNEFNDYELVFLNGKTKKDTREFWRLEANKNERKIIIIATYQLFQVGINITNLEHIFFCGPVGKSKIKLLQSIGRALRLYKGKEVSQIYDFIDCNNKWFNKHSDSREKHYIKNDFQIIEEHIYE